MKDNHPKPEELRLFTRYRVTLPLELRSAETTSDKEKRPPVHFYSSTIDVSLGGVLVNMTNKLKGLPENWDYSLIKDRYFWLHIKGIPTIPEGVFAKARAVRHEGDNENRPEAVGMEFQDLVRSTMKSLKEFLDSLTQ